MESLGFSLQRSCTLGILVSICSDRFQFFSDFVVDMSSKLVDVLLTLSVLVGMHWFSFTRQASSIPSVTHLYHHRSIPRTVFSFGLAV